MYRNSILLNNAALMPIIGLGTSTIEDPMQLKLAMEAALRSGYRHFDTSYINKNERIVGKIIERWISRGLLKREELFITAKLPMAGVHPDRVEMFLNKTLRNLGLNYVDLYLIQFPVCVKYNEIMDMPINEIGDVQTETTDLIKVWQKMEDISDFGKTRAIGLSNFNKNQIIRIMEKSRIKPAVLQIEIQPYFQNRNLVDFCGQKGITVVAYSPFGAPINIPFNNEQGSREKIPNPLVDKTVVSISEKYSKTPAQVVLRFLVYMGVAVISKSSNPSRIKENVDIFDFDFVESDIAKLKNLDRGDAGRINGMALKGLLEHPEYPFK